MLIWFSDYSPPVKSSFVQLFSYFFLGNWVLEMLIMLCCNFQCCFLVILPNNSHKIPTIPIRQLSLSSKVLLLRKGFFLLSQILSLLSRHYSLLHRMIPRFFVTQSSAIRAPTKFERSAILMNFDQFLLVM